TPPLSLFPYTTLFRSDHALLALDLLALELRVAEHVDEDVEGLVAELGRAFDEVAGVLLAGEGVELAADPVDLHADVPRGRAAFTSEEHTSELQSRSDL